MSPPWKGMPTRRSCRDGNPRTEPFCLPTGTGPVTGFSRSSAARRSRRPPRDATRRTAGAIVSERSERAIAPSSGRGGMWDGHGGANSAADSGRDCSHLWEPRSELGRLPRDAAGEFGGGRPGAEKRGLPGRDLRLRRPYSRRRNQTTCRQRAGRDVPGSPLSPDEGDARHGGRRSETGTRESTRFFRPFVTWLLHERHVPASAKTELSLEREHPRMRRPLHSVKFCAKDPACAAVTLFSGSMTGPLWLGPRLRASPGR